MAAQQTQTPGRGWRAFREDLAGFVTAWVIVIVLVLATALLLAV